MKKHRGRVHRRMALIKSANRPGSTPEGGTSARRRLGTGVGSLVLGATLTVTVGAGTPAQAGDFSGHQLHVLHRQAIGAKLSPHELHVLAELHRAHEIHSAREIPRERRASRSAPKSATQPTASEKARPGVKTWTPQALSEQQHIEREQRPPEERESPRQKPEAPEVPEPRSTADANPSSSRVVAEAPPAPAAFCDSPAADWAWASTGVLTFVGGALVISGVGTLAGAVVLGVDAGVAGAGLVCAYDENNALAIYGPAPLPPRAPEPTPGTPSPTPGPAPLAP